MNTLLAVAALITVGAVTPGPNNFIVFRTAAKAGLARTLPAIAGIVLGSLGLLLLAAAGGAAVFDTLPGLRLGFTLAGCLYLVWLGLRMVADSFAPKKDGQAALRLPAGLGGLAGFQFLNPKSWVLVLTAVAAMPPSSPLRLLELAALFVLIPAACLLLWSSCGTLMMRALSSGNAASWFDRAMGGALAASAAALFIAA